MTHYVIDVNLARLNSLEGNWTELTDEYGDPCIFLSLEEATRVLEEENRGNNAKIMKYVHGIGTYI